MAEGEEKKRPNANYQLTNIKTNPDEAITYHYSREHRLAKAPQSVVDMYTEKPRRRFGIFRSLVDTKPKAMLFFSILIMCMVMLVFSRIGAFGTPHELEGNQITFQAIEYEGTVILTLKKSVKNTAFSRSGSIYTGAVAIAVLPAGSTEPSDVFFHRIFFTHDPEELFRFAVPFDAVDLLVVLQTERNTLNATVRPE